MGSMSVEERVPTDVHVSIYTQCKCMSLISLRGSGLPKRHYREDKAGWFLVWFGLVSVWFYSWL